MFEPVILTVLVVLAALCLFFSFKGKFSKSIPIEDLYIETEDGEKKLLEVLANICSKTTKEVLQEQLNKVIQESFQQGYQAGFEDMKEQSIRIIQDESLNEQIKSIPISTIKS